MNNEDKFRYIWIHGDLIGSDYHKNTYYDYTTKSITKSDVLDNFSPNELLNMLDDKDIELYLRNKKLKKITKKIN